MAAEIQIIAAVIRHNAPFAGAAPAQVCSQDTRTAKAAQATRAMRPTRGLAEGEPAERPRFEKRTRCLRERLNDAIKVRSASCCFS
jgi:hypothetical protein